MTSKKYNLKDFYTKTRQETGTKMPLLYDGKDTGMFLMVAGIEARSVAQARFESQKEYALMLEMSEEIKDSIDKKKHESDEAERIKINLASVLVTGWSFEDDFSHEAIVELLEENHGLSDSVVAHASTASNYFAKK